MKVIMSLILAAVMLAITSFQPTWIVVCMVAGVFFVDASFTKNMVFWVPGCTGIAVIGGRLIDLAPSAIVAAAIATTIIAMMIVMPELKKEPEKAPRSGRGNPRAV